MGPADIILQTRKKSCRILLNLEETARWHWKVVHNSSVHKPDTAFPKIAIVLECYIQWPRCWDLLSYENSSRNVYFPILIEVIPTNRTTNEVKLNGDICSYLLVVSFSSLLLLLLSSSSRLTLQSQEEY